MVRKKAIDGVGMFDERYFFFFEETDWALQMKKAGWASWQVPDAEVYHLQGQSIGRNSRSREAFYRSRYQFFQKWKSRPLYLFHRTVVIVRLLANLLLTALGNLVTLGLSRGLRDKLFVYGKLMELHIKGII
jgi:GT2 family glycosyltransferase